MKTTVNAYDMCRRFVHDNSHVLEPSIQRRILGYIRSRSFERLVTCTSLQSSCTSYSAGTHRALMQVEAFFKKNASMHVGIDTEQKAMESFADSESLCAETNKRLDQFHLQRGQNDPDLERKVERMRSFIAKVLGPYDKFLTGLPERIRVTSGASSTRPRASSQPYLKVNKRLICTPRAAPYLDALSKFFGYGPIGARTRVWNRVVTVPKNWKTDRTIACEPIGNLPLQLAFDRYAKVCLRRHGIDLSDQSRNQDLAREGSIGNHLATLDLSAASDTLSFNTVALLLPWEWFTYLSDVRSPCYKTKEGAIVPYAKFSSMGNGATFALETLIFAAACHAAGTNNLAVYGDDLIVDSDVYDEVSGLLNFLGFKVNDEKSYADGPYRESCGMHYWHGEPVTPFFLRSHGNSKADLCHIVNGMMSLGHPGGQLWSYAREIVRAAKLPLVPFNLSSTSGVWIDPYSAHQLKLFKYRQWQPYAKTYVAKTREMVVADSRTYFLWFLSRLYRGNGSRGPWPNDLRSFALSFEPLLSSSLVPMPTNKFVRKWTVYTPVDRRYAPPDLYDRAEWLNAPIPGSAPA